MREQSKTLEDSKHFKIKNAKSFGPSKRFYLDLFQCGVATEGQLNSGADVSIMSSNLINMICPDWKTFPKSHRLRNTGVSGTAVKVIDQRIIPVSFSSDSEDDFPHPFIIIEEPDLLLLSSHAMYSKSLCITWDKSGRVPSLTWKDKPGKQRSSILSPHSQAIIGKLSVPLTIEGKGDWSHDRQFCHRNQTDRDTGNCTSLL